MILRIKYDALEKPIISCVFAGRTASSLAYFIVVAMVEEDTGRFIGIRVTRLDDSPCQMDSVQSYDELINNRRVTPRS